MDELEAYLEENGITARRLARAVGVTDPYFSKIRRGLFRPSLDIAFRIERATGGAVPASSWVEAPAADEGESASPASGEEAA